MAERTIPSASLLDSLIYNLVQTLPVFTQGLFTRNKFWASFWTRLKVDSLAVRRVTRLRKKHGDYVYLRVMTSKTLLVLDVEGIRHVLDNSPAVYADPDAKRKGMSHFQPNALTISRGGEWADRRRFNVSVLDPARDAGEPARQFLAVIRREVEAARESNGAQLSWADFAELFDRITLQIVFGDEALGDDALLGRLRRMMREANRVFGLVKSRHFDAFYDAVNGHLGRASRHSLASLSRETPSTPVTKVPNQIPHWLFAMSETLAANVVRAVALIASHPRAEARVREELAACVELTPEGVEGLRYVEACVQEAMRLWPTTPLLMRKSLRQDVIRGLVIPGGTQVLIHNTFNHRDQETHAFADRFTPELWLDGATDKYFFNHLSNGAQVCAGKGLALFIAKAVIAGLLAEDSYVLSAPGLDPGRPLPHMYNYFDIRLRRR